MSAPGRSTNVAVAWATGEGSEEETILARLPSSRRLRQIVRDFEAIAQAEGFLHFSVNDIAARLHCSKMTLYRLVESREELFELAVDLWLARVRDLGRRQFEAAESWGDRLIGFLNAAIVNSRPTSLEFMRDLRDFPGGRRAILAHQERRVADLERILAAGVRAGAFNDVHPKVAADVLLLTMRRFIEPDFLASVGLDLATVFDEGYKLIEYGLIRATPAATAGEADAQMRRGRLSLRVESEPPPGRPTAGRSRSRRS